ncbi:MAG: hypothetical protein QN120_12015 [Armatimonadota bacterium]|nr:hypothetical protein [Armatimonadota bacterium]
MIETVLVVLVLAVALAAGAVAWSYGRFAALRAQVLDYLRRVAPEVTVEALTDTGFRATVLGATVEVDLATLARRRPRAGDATAWLAHIADQIRAAVPTPDVPPFPLVEDRIFPQLKPTVYAEIFDPYPPAQRLVWRWLAPGVAITYVIVGTHQRTAITRRAMESWQQTAEGLHALALANLRRQTAHLLAEIGGPRHRYEHLDGLDATRSLVPELVIPPGTSSPLVAIPEESVLLVAPEADRAALAAEAACRHAAAARPLTDQVFRITPAGPVPVSAPEGPGLSAGSTATPTGR